MDDLSTSTITLKNNWSVNLEEDPETGETILPLPKELLDLQGWGDGTVIEWVPQEDGSFVLQKAKHGR